MPLIQPQRYVSIFQWLFLFKSLINYTLMKQDKLLSKSMAKGLVFLVSITIYQERGVSVWSLPFCPTHFWATHQMTMKWRDGWPLLQIFPVENGHTTQTNPGPLSLGFYCVDPWHSIPRIQLSSCQPCNCEELPKCQADHPPSLKVHLGTQHPCSDLNRMHLKRAVSLTSLRILSLDPLKTRTHAHIQTLLRS